MVKALRLIKAKMKIGCITNNIKNTSQVSDTPNANDKAIQVAEVMSLFDSVIESSKAGIRKPNPRIYQIACETMGVKPEEAVFLDDLGINLKPARALGMTTIKVLSENQALAELESCLDMSLR
jgi:putative hydrolase of the HAD superfamily